MIVPQKTLVKMVRKGEQNQGIGYRAHNTLLGSIYSQLGTAVGYEVYERVQCLPLQTLILAIGINHVHFVSLDVEGIVYISEEWLGRWSKKPTIFFMFYYLYLENIEIIFHIQ